MAESTLSITYDELAVIIAVFLGYSSTKADWSTDEVAELDRYIQAGLRQFYYPPAGDGVPIGYEWPFLKPTTTITTIPTYSTGSLAVVGGTCTLTDGTWPSWAATHGTLTIDDTVYAITTRDSDAELTVVGDDIVAAADGWSLTHSGYQDLPDDLGRVIGDFYYASTEFQRSIVQVSEGQIQADLSHNTDVSYPIHANTRFKDQEAPDGQRQEVVWYPKPDSVYVLTYQYEAYSGKLSTAGNPYPLGGMKYSELLTESCLAKAEQRANDEQGLHTVEFNRLLVAGIAFANKHGAVQYGPMSQGTGGTYPTRHGCTGGTYPTRHGCTGGTYPITCNGETW